MNLLKVVANNYKLCDKNFTISFIPEANKTAADKEFELNEIDDNLFVFNTLGIIGKNASGKTTAAELIVLVYEILSSHRVDPNVNLFVSNNKNIELDITFYHDGNLYRYMTELCLDDNSVKKNIFFSNEKIYKRKYLMSYSKNLFDYTKYSLIENKKEFPKDISIIYEIFKDNILKGVYYSSEEQSFDYAGAFKIYNIVGNNKLIESTIKMFDEHINEIIPIADNKYKVYYKNKEAVNVSGNDLTEILSSGTKKGFFLFAYVIYSLKTGADLIIDEIENHFHKQLVQNLVNLYKSKSVNKKNATLIFTTHYCELLDLFNRTDNIYITKNNDKINIENMYKNYSFRPELSKSKKFYENAFETNVNYDALMDFKKELM